MPRPFFSAVIPTFNYGPYLRRAIDSVLAQAGADCEVIVVDDGSTDDTSSIAQSYGQQLRYVHQQRAGVFQACRRGLIQSRGRYIVFFDADDALTPHAIAHLRAAIDRRPNAGLVAGRHVTVAAAGRKESPTLTLGASRTRNFRSFLLGGQVICTGATAIRRDAVELLLRYQGDLRVGLETACIAHALWHHDAVALDEVLLEVHEHPGRLRDNLPEIQRAGDALVDAVFHPAILPPEAARFREPFRARLLRDRARSYHRAELHAETVRHFHAALRSDPWRTLRDVRNLRRYAISRLRQRTEPAGPVAVPPLRSQEQGVVLAGASEPFWGHRRRLGARPHEFLRQAAALGDVVKIQLARPTYLLSNSRDILHVFVEQTGRYQRTGLQAAFRMLFGRGLFTRTGRDHIDHRRLVQPLLHRARLDGYLPPMQQTLSESLAGWRDGQSLDVNNTILNITVRAAARMILGVESAAEAAELFAAIHATHHRTVRTMQARVPMPAWLPTKRNRTMRSHVAMLNETMRRLIHQAREAAQGPSILSQLVHLRDAAGATIDDQLIRDHALTLFLAAYEPPATSLMWLFHLLAAHPEVQTALQAEIDQHRKKGTGVIVSTTTRPPEQPPGLAAELWQRPYMSQVIAEALRLYPSTWLLTRRAAERDQLPSGARIPKGADVFASPLLVHRDDRRYDRPDEFRPDRFAAGTAERRAAGDYFPFGLGPTACLGEYLARLMLAATLDATLCRFRLEPRSTTAPQMHSTNLFTMQPDRPIELTIRRRTQRASSAA